MERITSRQNSKILDAISLRERKIRKEKGLFYFEGKKLFREAVERTLPLVTIFKREDLTLGDEFLARLPEECRVYEVSGGVYEKLTEEKSPEGLFCIAKTLDKTHKFDTIYRGEKYFPTLYRKQMNFLMAVSLRDPGNLGTVIRSAAAFGYDGIILSADCADLYSSKTIRATMGTLFDTPVLVVDDPIGTIEALKKDGFAVYGAALDRAAVKLNELPYDEKCCFLVGNEGRGLPADILSICTGTVFIPMSPHAESLNASVAASVLMYSRFIARQ